MKSEIERKYLLNLADVPAVLNELEYADIEQGYLLWNDEGGESRLRRIGNQHKLTIKKGKGIKRTEVEIDISEDQYRSLWLLTEGKRLYKTRYYLNESKHVIEIDVYSGKAAGLVVAEVEFMDIEDCKSYIPPHWFGREISENEAFRNRNLAVE